MVSNKLQPSLAEKAEQALTWECVFGRGEGKTPLRIEETLLKEKCLIFSLSSDREDEALAVSAKAEESSLHTLRLI